MCRKQILELMANNLPRTCRRLIRDIAETAGGGSSGHGNVNGDSITTSKSRIGRKTREKVQAVATADGGLELEVSDDANAVRVEETLLQRRVVDYVFLWTVWECVRNFLVACCPEELVFELACL